MKVEQHLYAIGVLGRAAPTTDQPSKSGDISTYLSLIVSNISGNDLTKNRLVVGGLVGIC